MFQWMGVPLHKLICASNENNVLTELINTGHYNVASRGPRAIVTMSPAIDITRASNLERYIHDAVGRDGHTVAQLYRQLDHSGRFQLPPQVRRIYYLRLKICYRDIFIFTSPNGSEKRTSNNKRKKTSCARGDTICPRPSHPPVAARAPRAPPSRHNVAVLSHAQYVPTLTAAATLRVKAALSKAAW